MKRSPSPLTLLDPAAKEPLQLQRDLDAAYIAAMLDDQDRITRAHMCRALRADREKEQNPST